MAEMTPNELLDWLEKEQFLPPAQAQEMRGTLADFPSSHALAKELLQRNWLTPFQANQILQGKGDTLIVGPNRLMLKLGEGAMGQVFKAWNIRLGRFVAIKMIHKNLLASPRALDRFRREMETASHLDHPNIVLLRDAGELDSRPYIVMDFFEGTNLSQLVKTRGALPIEEACEFARQAALGLQHALDRGVIHRDIKPGNLLLTAGPDQKAVVKILDFGLARFETERSPSRLTQVGNIIGTIDYIAPEQVENAQKADIRSDIYSLGCTLYFLLTGRPPFPGADVVEKVGARLMGDVPSARALRQEIPPSLDNVLHRMMVRNPDERYQTPREVAQALSFFIGQPLPIAMPVPPSTSGDKPLLVAQPVFSKPGTPPLAMPVTASTPPPVAADAAIAAADTLPPFPSPLGDFAAPEDAEPVADDGLAGNLDFSQAPPPRYVADVQPIDGDGEATPHAKDSSRSLLLLAAGALGGLVLILLVAAAFFFFGNTGPKLAYPGGSLRLMPVGPMTVQEGVPGIVIVTVERKGFRGPVKIRLENPPSGITARPVVIPAEADSGQLSVVASYTTAGLQASVRIVASAEELSAQQNFSISVIRPKS